MEGKLNHKLIDIENAIEEVITQVEILLADEKIDEEAGEELKIELEKIKEMIKEINGTN